MFITRKRVLATAVSAMLVVLGVLAAAQSQRGRGSLTALDYEEIRQLYSRYAIGVDSGNSDLFASAFTADGIFELPTRTVQGRKQLAEIAKPGDERGPTNVSHVAVNMLIEPTAEGATGTSYFIRVKLGQKGEASAVSGGGVYRDTFVKTSEGWRIKKRTVQPAHSVPPTKTQ